MKTLTRLAALLLLLVIPGCSDMIDYDIEEVAPAEFLSAEDEHDHEHHEEGPATPLDSTAFADTQDLGLHQHGTGVRNHGTQWFFNQPWAASFVWGKMLRDSIILLVLAVSVVFLPRLRKKRK